MCNRLAYKFDLFLFFFSFVEVIESYNAINNHQLIRGSIEQVTACCDKADDVFNCILEKLHGGICTQDAYNTSSGSCDHHNCQPFFTVND